MIRFDALIDRLEKSSKENPNLYALKVLGLAMLGYAYIWFILIVVILLTIILVILLIKAPYLIVKLGLPMLLVIGIILRSFWIKLEPIQGISISRKDAPEVFRTVEEIRKAIQGPRIDKVLLVSEFNAAIVQLPRLGMLGWHENCLMLGLPLMQSLTLDQFRAVLSHELGHLSGNHGRLRGKIYRARAIWEQLLTRLTEQGSIGTLLFSRFFKWYVPYFDAYSFVLARMQEYQADLCSVEMVDKYTAADALININIKGQYLNERYWTNIYEDSRHSPDAPKNAYTAFPSSLAAGLKESDVQIWLDNAFRARTDHSDTHPALTDRLTQILGLAPDQCRKYAEDNVDQIIAVETSAADHMLGAGAKEYLERWDRDWYDTNYYVYSQRYDMYKNLELELEELEAKDKNGALKGNEIKMIALRTAQLRGFTAARPLFRRAFEKIPDDADLYHAYGQCLSDEKNDECISYFEKCMELEPSIALECSQEIYAYLRSQHRIEESRTCEDRIQKLWEERIAAQNERQTIDEKDEYESHRMPPEDLRKLVDELSRFDRIKTAHLLRKKLNHYPELPLYVLVIKPFRTWKLTGGNPTQDLIDQVSQTVEFPDTALVIAYQWAPARLKKAIKTMDSTVILDR